MKPRTKLHHEVLRLHKKLPKITSKHTKWAYAKIFKFWAYKTKHTTVCFECGYKWKEERGLLSTLACTCPKCHKPLNIAETMSWSKTECNYFQIVTTIQGFQVLRMIEIYHYCKKGYEAHYAYHEVYQHWLSSKGKLVILAVGSNPMEGWRSGHTAWCWHQPMEVKGDNNRYYINDAKSYPERRILPIIKRNGYHGKTYGYNLTYLFQLLLSEPIFETLIKTNQVKLAEIFLRYDNIIKLLWPQIKICIRNKYIIPNFSIWKDHISMLKDEGKDIFNAKYICPADLMAEHQRMIDKKNKIKNEAELLVQAERIKKANPAYIKAKKPYLNFVFSDGNIKIAPLQDVKDFLIEGQAMHHCVFSNEYYKEKDSLILSASKDNRRLETIEISISQLRVMQIRGACNQDSEYHSSIVKLTKSIIPAIEKISKEQKRIKEKV